MIQASRPDVLVNDIGMPDQDGCDLIRQLRAWEAENQDGKLPSVALAAFARSADRTRVLVNRASGTRATLPDSEDPPPSSS